jgi:WD repeat-containing protein 24
MSHDQQRRDIPGAASTQASIPHAPPLPAPRPLQRARDAAYRVLGYPAASRPSSAQDEARFASLPAGRYASLGATQNATVSHKTGLEINSITVNERGTHALLAGKEIFKTIKIEDGTCAEELNLRSAIRSTEKQASGKPRQIYSVDIADVAWGKQIWGNHVAAATSSGKIILYDLGRADLHGTQLHEHYRQVHRVTFNPHSSYYLLSGSQDGTVRLWDIRETQHQAGQLQSKRKYSGQTDGVRDVKWSPTDGVDFAFGTDSGWIQCWDIRKMNAAKVKIPAHALACNMIDWHPDGKHVISGSTDKSVRVWDMSVSGRQKAAWEIKTPYPVLNARWRPSCESSKTGSGLRQCTQLVTAYDREHPVVHVWDFRRPALPFREMAPYPSAPTDLLWHSQDLMWTVGREGVFLQTDVVHASNVINRRALQSFDISVVGDVRSVVQKRQSRRTPSIPQGSMATNKAAETGLSVSPDAGFLTRSRADDTLDHSFLTAHSPKQRSRAKEAAKMVHSQISPGNVQPFDESMREQGVYVPQQVAFEGRLPFFPDPEVFKWLARKYTMNVDLKPVIDDTFLGALDAAFANNRRQALLMGQRELARNWKIVGFWAVSHLKARMKHQEELKAKGLSLLGKCDAKPTLGQVALQLLADRNKSPIHSPASARPISALAQQLAMPESTSNVPTPLARPLTSTSKTSGGREDTHLPDPDHEEHLTLPPSLQSSLPERPAIDRKLTVTNLSGLEQLHSNTDRIDMVRKWSMHAREPLSLNPGDSSGVKVPPRLEKHDSNESFAFLAGSTDSRVSSLPASFKSEGPDELVAERPSRRPIPQMQERPELPVPATEASEVLKDDTGADYPSIHAPSSPKPKTFASSSHSDDELEPLHFLPDDPQVDLEEDRPVTLVAMLQKLMQFHAENVDAQTAVTLITLLEPLLPKTHELPQEEKEATVLHYAETYSSMGFTDKEIADIFDKHLSHTMMAGLQPLQIEAIMSGYHEKLVRMRMSDSAAYLRQLAYPAYPAVYEDYMVNNEVHIRCGVCQKAVNSGMSTWRCENCGEKQAACSYCSQVNSPFGGGKLMTTCLLCNHSGHAECMNKWFGEDGGDACPTACGCDCVAGQLREELAKKAKSEVKVVKQDTWEAKESNAVQGATAKLL